MVIHKNLIDLWEKTDKRFKVKFFPCSSKEKWALIYTQKETQEPTSVLITSKIQSYCSIKEVNF